MAQEATATSLVNVNVDCFDVIAQYLRKRDLLALSGTCKNLARVVDGHRLWWNIVAPRYVFSHQSCLASRHVYTGGGEMEAAARALKSGRVTKKEVEKQCNDKAHWNLRDTKRRFPWQKDGWAERYGRGKSPPALDGGEAFCGPRVSYKYLLSFCGWSESTSVWKADSILSASDAMVLRGLLRKRKRGESDLGQFGAAMPKPQRVKYEEAVARAAAI